MSCIKNHPLTTAAAATLVLPSWYKGTRDCSRRWADLRFAQTMAHDLAPPKMWTNRVVMQLLKVAPNMGLSRSLVWTGTAYLVDSLFQQKRC
ncbi:hypothetical protein COB21_05080 [Candidatus Aerophobetes bacterium]|uniref:Uncharacterized protein n=1 Tax=Aerophobetes bacterium TaxID=2030807 RepID=A0A2A4X072_UNCAE|nr:MAG: hypothetical protein COB21_05080 [Candidatus Aerophobetes bacterium]